MTSLKQMNITRLLTNLTKYTKPFIPISQVVNKIQSIQKPQVAAEEKVEEGKNLPPFRCMKCKKCLVSFLMISYFPSPSFPLNKKFSMGERLMLCKSYPVANPIRTYSPLPPIAHKS